MLLSKIIHQFKSSVTREINKRNDFHFAWQRSFHDRVIRNEKEFPPKADPPLVENNKRNYI
ncbi:MAG: transposase, partial [Candidatus Buchananbacteria bacterium]|nr:transposase [Candidatus Buchananbacteria bacterium]